MSHPGVRPPLLWCSTIAATGFAILQLAKAVDVSYEGVVIHEVPQYYEADNVTLKNTTTKVPLRFLTNRPESGAVGDAMGRVVPILKQLVRDLNTRSDILPNHILELYLTDSMCAPQKGVQSTLRLLYPRPRGFFHMEFGPLCSGPTAAVNDILQVFNLFQLATISRSPSISDGNRYPFICRTSPPLQFVATGLTRFLQLFGWTKIGTIQDASALARSTINSFKSAVTAAISAGYAFDLLFLNANTLAIDEVNFFASDVVENAMKAGVRVFIMAVYESIGAKIYCEMYKRGFYGKNLQTILALSWWGDTWITEQVAEQRSLACSAGEVFTAAKHMFSLGQTAFFPSDTIRHGITGYTLNAIKRAYLDACTAEEAEGCHNDFASYDYDGLALAASVFHTWLYTEGHRLTEIDYTNTAPRQRLYEIMKGSSFFGTSGNVAFFNQTSLDCERKGTFSVRQYMNLADKGQVGWSELVSYTDDGGFGGMVPWSNIEWQDGTSTFFGTGQGFGSAAAAAGVHADFGGAQGLTNIPQDALDCPLGQRPNTLGTACESCPAGTSAPLSGSNRCDPCLPGRATDQEGSIRCPFCPSGQYQDLPGQAACKDCAPGNISDAAKPWRCLPCEAGSFQDLPGQSACKPCERGRYQTQEQASACESCPSQRTTELLGAKSQALCVCPQDSYEPFPVAASDPFRCLGCPTGMKCGTGSRVRAWLEKQRGWAFNGTSTYPTLTELYFTTPDRPVYVYKCKSVVECPGGDPGSCGDKRVGFACGRCAKGYYSFGGTCQECTQVELSSILFPVLPFIGGPLICAFIYSRLLEPFRTDCVDSQKNKALSLVFFIIVYAQTIGLISQLNLKFPSIVAVTWEVSHMFNSGIQFLRPECSGGGSYSNFEVQFIIRTLAPCFVVGMFAFTWLLSRLIARMLGPGSAESASKGNAISGQGRKLMQGIRNGMDKYATINAVGTVMYTFSIAVLAIAFDLFKCYSHPNGLSSLFVSPDVLCGESTWTHLLAIGILAILFYCILTYAFFWWIVWVAPVRFGSPIFRRTWKFLLVKWRPSVWWWGQIFLLKGILLNLTLVMFKSGAVQLVWVTLVLMCYNVGVMVAIPWRHTASQIMEVITTTFLICVSTCCVFYTIREDGDADALFRGLMVMLSIVPIGIIILLAGYLICDYLKDPQHDASYGVSMGFELFRIVHALSNRNVQDLVHAMASISNADRVRLLQQLSMICSEVFREEHHLLCGPGLLGGKRLLQSVTIDLPQDGGVKDTVRAEAEFHQHLSSTNAREIFGERMELSREEFQKRTGEESWAKFGLRTLDLYNTGVVTRRVYDTMAGHVQQFEQDLVAAAVNSKRRSSLNSEDMKWSDVGTEKSMKVEDLSMEFDEPPREVHLATQVGPSSGKRPSLGSLTSAWRSKCQPQEAREP